MLKIINLLVSLRQVPPLSELTGDEERLLFQLKALFDRQGKRNGKEQGLQKDYYFSGIQQDMYRECLQQNGLEG